jgi:hypothetical protein
MIYRNPIDPFAAIFIAFIAGAATVVLAEAYAKLSSNRIKT